MNPANRPVTILGSEHARAVAAVLQERNQLDVRTAETIDDLRPERETPATVVVTEFVDGYTPIEAAAVVAETAPSSPIVIVSTEAVPERALEAIGVRHIVSPQRTDTDGIANAVVDAIHSLGDTTHEILDTQPIAECLVDASPNICCTLTPTLELSRWNARTRELTGYDDAELTTRPFLDLLSESDAECVLAAAEAVLDGESRSLETGLLGPDGESIPHELSLVPIENEQGAVVGIGVFGRDISERRKHARTLDHLNRITREFVRSESPAEVCRRIADATTVLIGESATVYQFDDELGRLEPIATGGDPTANRPQAMPVADTGEQVADGRIPIEPAEDDPGWQAFIDGATTVRGDDPATGTCAYVPLGQYGLLVIEPTAATELDDQTLEIVETLTTNAEAVLSRISRERELKQHDKMLSQRTERLAKLNEVNDRVRKITNALLGVTTREAVSRIVCERLADADPFALVWLGEVDERGESVTPRQWAGDEQGYLDAIDRRIQTDDETPEPAVHVAKTSTPTVVRSVAEGLRDGHWQREALARGYRSVFAVSLSTGQVADGILTVYANSTETFDDETQMVLSELAATIAGAIRSVEQRQTLLSDQQVELEFSIGKPTTTLLAFAQSLPATVTIDRVLPQTEASHLAYGTVTGIDAETFESALEDAVGIEHGRVLSSRDDELAVELRVAGPSVARMIVDRGGQFKRLVARSDSRRVTMAFPTSVAASEFIEQFTQRYPSSELQARRESTRGDHDDGRELDLTRRQREVLEVAYHSGFFEWPRESTGKAVAASLDIAPSTFQEHLRHCVRKLTEDALGSRVDGHELET